MHSKSAIDPESETAECVRCIQIEGWNVELLPGAPYEVSYTPQQSIIGYSFDSQEGYHAFAGSRKKQFRAVPNGLAWVPAGCDVYSQSTGGEYLKISCAYVPSPLASQERRFSDVVNPTAITAAFALRCALLSHNDVDHLACEHWLLTLESSVGSALSESGYLEQPRGWLNRYRLRQIDEFIEAHLDTPLSVNALAREFNISEGFFYRAFKRALGRTPHQYIVDRRLANARAQLHQKHRDLSAIALDSGFSSHSHMTALFRERLGVTPTQLRRQC